MSGINNDSSSLQTTSSLTPANSLNKKISEEPKRRKSPFSMQKELFINHSELLSKYSNCSHSVSPQRKRLTDKVSLSKIELFSSNISNSNQCLSVKRKKVTFKSNFVQVINVISYKKYYIEDEKQKQQQEGHLSRCNCFIF